MEENRNTTGATTQGESMGNEAQESTEGKGKEQKLFSQEEVDEIVRKRLARERKKADSEGSAADSERENTLSARELRVMAQEKLLAAGMPTNLADVLRYSDEESLDAAMKVIMNTKQEAPRPWGQRVSAGARSTGDPFRKAWGLAEKADK